MFNKIKSHLGDLVKILTAPKNRLMSYHHLANTSSHIFAHSNATKTHLCLNICNGNLIAAVVHITEWIFAPLTDYHCSYLSVSEIPNKAKLADILKIVSNIQKTYNPDITIYINHSQSHILGAVISELGGKSRCTKWIMGRVSECADTRTKCLLLFAHTVKNNCFFVSDIMCKSFLSPMAMCAMYLKVSSKNGLQSVSYPITKNQDEALSAAILETLALSHFEG